MMTEIPTFLTPEAPTLKNLTSEFGKPPLKQNQVHVLIRD